MKKNQIDIVTMGCSKNLVDSETLMKLFEDNGYHCVHDPKRPQGEIAVINTCGFIEDAKQESIDTILEFIQAKEEGRLRKLYVMGCLSQRYQKELEAEMPEVDKFYGKFNYKELLKELGKADVPACSGAAISLLLIIMPISRFLKVATAAVRIAPFLSSLANTFPVRWMKSSTRYANL